MTPRTAPRNSRPPASRQRLLAGAAELFTRKGYAATTVREIVARAGVTKPVLYYYFRSKAGIYQELMRATFAKLDVLVAGARGEEGSAASRLLQFCDQAFRLFLENIKVVRIMYAIYYGPPQGAPPFDFEASHRKFQQAIRRLVEEGVRRGEFRPGKAGEITWLVLGAFNVVMEVRLGRPQARAGRGELARVLHLIFQGVQAGKDRRG